MTESGVEIAAGAGGHSRLIASQADREQVLDALKAAFVQGRLTKAEFDHRVGQALASYAELDALTADIRFAGRPTRFACSRMIPSSVAIYTQYTLSPVT